MAVDGIASLAVLADPVRRALFDAVVGAGEPIGRAAAAAGAGVPEHSARHQLERLVEAGLLEVHTRRLTGRSGPGAGRPARLYSPSREEVAVSVPPRHYDLAGEVLAAAAARSLAGEDLARCLRDEARARGRALAAPHPAPGEPPRGPAGTEVVCAVLADAGYEPVVEEAGVALRNCPFDRLARTHRDLVCGLNVDLVQGVLDGLGCVDRTAVLDPRPDRCCVRVAPRPGG